MQQSVKRTIQHGKKVLYSRNIRLAQNKKLINVIYQINNVSRKTIWFYQLASKKHSTKFNIHSWFETTLKRVGTAAEHARRSWLFRVILFPARSGCHHGPGKSTRTCLQKNMKKSQEISKGKRKEDSLTSSQRKQRDSEIMQQKQKAANEKKSMQTREK